MHKYNGRCSNLLLHSKWIGCRVRALHKNNIFLQNHNKELLLVIYIWFYRAIIAVEWCKQYYAFIIHISSDSVLTREWVCCRQQMPLSQCTDSTIRAEEKKNTGPIFVFVGTSSLRCVVILYSAVQYWNFQIVWRCRCWQCRNFLISGLLYFARYWSVNIDECTHCTFFDFWKW